LDETGVGLVHLDLAVAVVEINDDVVAVVGWAAIDDERGTDVGLAARFVDMAAEDKGGLSAFDETTNRVAAGGDSTVGAVDGVVRRGMGDQHGVAGGHGLVESALEAKCDFGFRDFIRSPDGDGGGGAPEEGDIGYVLRASIDGDAELFQALVDCGRIHIAGDGEQGRSEGFPGSHGALGIGGSAVGGDIACDEDDIDGWELLERPGDGVEAAVDISESDEFHEC
jgi:hypothetical protein